MLYVFIYALSDPRTNQIRYIGKANNPYDRYSNHYNSSRDKNTHKRNWINNIRKEGLRPELIILDEVPKINWQYWEKFYISLFKSWGFDLVNYTGGGDGSTFSNNGSFRKGNVPHNKGVTCKEDELWIQCGKSNTKIKGTSSEDYPIIPSLEEGKKYVINAEDLKNGLSGVLSSVAKNDIRPELSGVFSGFNLNGKPGVTFAATDSYRLAEKSIPLAQGQDELRIIIPGRTAQELARLLSLNAHLEEMDKQVTLLINENQLKFECGTVQLISRLVEGNYPDYTQIVPKEFRTTVLVSKEQLIKEIKAAGLFTTTGVNSVNFVFKPAEEVIHVSSTSLQAGEYSSEINAECKGEENKTLLSYRYILEGLNNMPGDKVVIKIINGDSPCIITPENDTSFLYIVMPIRQ
jgi:DNA polymerase-3 subunit beta